MPAKKKAQDKPKQTGASAAGFHFIDLYKNCERKFYFKFLCRLTTKHTPEALIQGSAFHEGKALFYESGSKKRALTLCRKCISDAKSMFETSTLYDRARERTPVLLASWIDTYGQSDLKNYKVIAVERNFKLKVPGTNYFFTGRIDAILQDRFGSNYIFETKTSGFSKDMTERAVAYGDQTTAYYWGAEESLGIKVDGIIADVSYWNKNTDNFDNIKHSRNTLVKRTPEDVEWFKRDTAQKLSEMNQKVQAWRKGADGAIFTRNTFYCTAYGRECEFANICRTNITPKTRPPQGMTRDKNVKTVKQFLAPVDDVQATS